MSEQRTDLWVEQKAIWHHFNAMYLFVKQKYLGFLQTVLSSFRFLVIQEMTTYLWSVCYFKSDICWLLTQALCYCCTNISGRQDSIVDDRFWRCDGVSLSSMVACRVPSST